MFSLSMKNLHSFKNSKIPQIYTIYENPADFPGKFVVRLWQKFSGENAYHPTVYVSIKNTLEEARKTIPRGLTRLNRMPNDTKVVVESWV